MGDRVGIELLYNWVWVGCQKSCQHQTSRQLQTRCGRESHIRPRGASEPPDGVDPNIRRTRKTQRDGHNSGVKIWSLCSVSSTLLHANLEQPFRTLAINWEVNIFLKKSSCVFLPSCVFLRASVSIIESLWYGKWVSPQAFTPFGGGCYCLAPEAPQKGECRQGRKYFWPCRTRVGFGPATGHTLKTALCHIRALVGHNDK